MFCCSIIRKEEYLSAIPPLARLGADLAGRRSGKLIFWGHSLGAGFCAALAANTPVRSTLVLEGAFANYHDVKDAKAGIAAAWVGLTIDPETLQFNIPELLSAYPGPIVVVASEDDETIPYAATRRLVDRLAGKAVSFVTLHGSGHGDLRHSPEYGAKMQAALGLVPAPAATTPTPPSGCSDRLVIEGCGTLTWPDGSKLVGGFRNGKFHGPVTVTFADGARLEAEFQNGDAHGIAHYVGPDGGRHDGLFVDADIDRDRTPKAAETFPFWRKLTAAEANINVYVVISPDGDIGNMAVDVPSSFNAADTAALDEMVRATFLQWKFRPATVAGHPVPLPAVLSIHYGTGR
jgi:pimeloyl-ACP methyl ester carboxylesterase